MVIEECVIKDILKLYELKQDFNNSSLMLDIEESDSLMKIKKIIKLEFNSQISLVLKLSHEKNITRDIIEEQSVFSEKLRNCGVITPRRFISDCSYCIIYLIEELQFLVTIEEFLGDEIRYIDEDCVIKIATLMASNHKISQKTIYILIIGQYGIYLIIIQI